MSPRLRRPNLNTSQREKIAHLRGSLGWSYAQIAKHLDLSIGSVSWYCLLDAIDKPGGCKSALPPIGPMTMSRGRFVVRRFTSEDDNRLLQLEAEGKKLSEIARVLGRKRNSVLGRLATLARREERSAA